MQDEVNEVRVTTMADALLHLATGKTVILIVADEQQMQIINAIGALEVDDHDAEKELSFILSIDRYRDRLAGV